MRPGPIQVSESAQRDRVVDILVGAFFEDPTWACAFPDAQTRAEHHRWLWRLAVDGAVRYPFTWLSASGAAAAVWIPPGGTEMSPAQETELESGLRERLGAGAGRVLEAFARFAAHRPQDEPHYYLSLLGTDAASRGRGHGLALLADNLGEVDRLGAAAYLEASNPANVALYQRYGFAIRGTFEPFDDGPTVTTMWRDPADGARPILGED